MSLLQNVIIMWHNIGFKSRERVSFAIFLWLNAFDSKDDVYVRLVQKSHSRLTIKIFYPCLNPPSILTPSWLTFFCLLLSKDIPSDKRQVDVLEKKEY